MDTINNDNEKWYYLGIKNDQQNNNIWNININLM